MSAILRDKDMDVKSFKEALDRYIELTTRARLLSAPGIAEISSEEDYRSILVDNFTEIGEMALEIKELLDDFIYPVLNGDGLLSDEEHQTLGVFSKDLVNTSTLSYLDPTLSFRVAERLIDDAEKKQDEALLIRSLDNMVDSSYIMMNLAFRLNPYSNMEREYRKKGLEAAKRILTYLDKDKFAALPDEATKETVLVDSRYINALEFLGDKMSDEARGEMFAHLSRSLNLENDSFYVENAPGYDWKRHKFRTYQYVISCTEKNNICCLTADELEAAHNALNELEKMWREDEEFCVEMCPRSTMDLYAARIHHLVGKLDDEEYKKELRRIYDEADKKDYDIHGIISNLFTVEEYLLTVRETTLTEDDEAFLSRCYRGTIAYIQSMPKKGRVIFANTVLSDIIKAFVDIPDFTFTIFCMSLIAAIHPPTYVHTLTMSSLVSNLTFHLAKKRPELFMEFTDCETPDNVSYFQGDLLAFATRSALSHDIGKLFVIEFIMTYGRSLFDEEFLMIKKHPDTGAYALRAHESSRQYQAMAVAHHLRFDELEAKAEEGLFSRAEIPFIGLATCADALDAATDTVGRSYKKGKDIETVIQELRDGSGTFYAPFVVELFDDPRVVEDVKRILGDERDDNYRKTFRTLAFLAE